MRRMESSQWRGPGLWEGGTHLTAVLPQTHTLARGGMQDGVENPPRPRCPQEQGPTSRGQMATAFLNPHLRGNHIPGFSAPRLVLLRRQKAVNHSSCLV